MWLLIFDFLLVAFWSKNPVDKSLKNSIHQKKVKLGKFMNESQEWLEKLAPKLFYSKIMPTLFQIILT